MKKLLYILIALFIGSCALEEADQIDYYIADTTLSIWSQKFNKAIFDYTGSTDTIELGVDSLLTWSRKVNVFIDSVPGTKGDTIIYGSDNFEAWRTKFNAAVDSASYPLYYYIFNGTNSIGTVPDTSLMDSPNLVLNYSFEDFTGIADDLISDAWTTWVESSKLADSTHLAITTTAHGSYELKMLHTDDPPRTPSVYQDITVEENTEYILRFKYKCDVLGRYRVYDNSNAADIIATKVVDDTTTQLNYLCQQEPFITPVGCTSIRIYFYTAGSASFYTLDEVFLSKPFSFSVGFYLKRNIDSVNIDRDYFVSHFSANNTTGNQQRAWSVRSLGDFSPEGDRGKINFAVSKYGTSTTQFVNSTFELTPDVWYHIVCTQEYLTLGTSNLKIYINGVLDNQNLNVPGYAFNAEAPFTIADIDPAPFHPAECQISDVTYDTRVFTLDEIIELYRTGSIPNTKFRYRLPSSTNILWVNDSLSIDATMSNTTLTTIP